MVLAEARLGGDGVGAVVGFGNGQFWFSVLNPSSDSGLTGFPSWVVGDEVMVTNRFGGDPGGFLSGWADPVWISAWPVFVERYTAVLGVDMGLVLPPDRWLIWVELFPSSTLVVGWSLPVMVLPQITSFGNLDHWDTLLSEAFLSFSLLLRFVCVFSFFFSYRKINQGWIVGYSQAMGTDQLGWVCTVGGEPVVVILPVSCCCMGIDQLGWVYADVGDLAVVILPVSWFWFRRGTDQLEWVCTFYYYFSFILFSSALFSCNACPRGFLLHGCCLGCCTLCALSVIMRWRAIIKWLLPPSVKMKRKAIKPLCDFGRLHIEEVGLLNLVLCLSVGLFSLLDNCYFKTDRVARCALSVIRRKLEYMYFMETPTIIVGFSLYALFVLGFRLYVPPCIHCYQ